MPLLMALIMFPQIVETIYSPALPAIAKSFSVSANQAGQTLSWYFLAFAMGVVIWGYACDIWGRRPTVLLALMVYVIASIAACYAPDFTFLLLCRLLMAFAAAIGSIGTQTMMRDQLSGHQLRQVFAVMGVAMAISPIIGLISGAILVHIASYQGVFWALAFLAIGLLAWCVVSLPETRPHDYQRPLFWQTAKDMINDPHIWQTVALISLLNIALFSYYQLAPFMFIQLGFSASAFGYSGILMGLGSFMGAWLNRYYLVKQVHYQTIIFRAATLAFICAISLWIIQHHIVFIIPMIGIVVAYGLAIPNILSLAFKDYGNRLGTAGAILGLLYYLGIGLGLMLVAQYQNLGLALSIIAVFLVLLTCPNRKEHNH